MKSNLELMQNVVKPYIDAKNQALTNKLEDEAETRAALGAHNLLDNVSTTETFKGIPFTVNSDKTITANGTSNGSGYFFINNNVVLDPGQYILSDGVGTINTNTTPYIRLGDASNNFVGSCKNDNNGLFAFTVTERSRYQVSIAIGESGLVANNITYKPMICLATDSDPTYQPYAKTNVELTQDSAYHKGDTIAFTSQVNAFPCIYTSGKKIRTYVKLDKPIGDDVSALTFANSYVEVWGDGVDYNVNTDVTEVACSFAKGESGIIIVLTADITSQGYTANNNYICILNGTLTLS